MKRTIFQVRLVDEAQGDVRPDRSIVTVRILFSAPSVMRALALLHKKSISVLMQATTVIRARIDPRRKARAEAILRKLGVSPTQAINMLYAQIELRKAIPFPLGIEDNRSVAVPIEHVAHVWDQLDQEDYSHLAKS